MFTFCLISKQTADWKKNDKDVKWPAIDKLIDKKVENLALFWFWISGDTTLNSGDSLGPLGQKILKSILSTEEKNDNYQSCAKNTHD